MTSFNDLIGIPFVNRGRDPRTGFDCWGLFRTVQRRFGHDVPDVLVSAFDPEDIARNIEQMSSGWTRVDSPEPGDAVTLAFDPSLPGFVQHVGVYIGNGKFLHTMEKTGSILAPLDHPFWKDRVRGYYRWTG